jgi:hypothetical protein
MFSKKYIGISAVIIVALIGAVATITAAVISKGSSNEIKETHFLKILNVSLDSNVVNRGIRIAGIINETEFSYPSNGLVIKPDIFLPPQQFEIKKDKSGFNCYFEIIVLDDICQIYDLKPPCSLKITDFAYSGVYKMELSNSEINPVTCQIEFKIY